MSRVRHLALAFGRSPLWMEAGLPLALGLILYIVTALAAWPAALAVQMKASSAFVTAGVTLLVMYPLFRIRLAGFRAAGIAIGIALFALPLSGLWHHGWTDGSTLAGLLPFSDASGYFTEANALRAGHEFSAFSARRPIFVGVLAALLGFTDGNLRLVSGAFGFVAGAAAMLAARTVLRAAGPMAATLFFGLVLQYYCRFAGTVLTEQIGLPLGLVAFVMLWRGAASGNRQLAMAGLFTLTVALSARAGAMLVLPVLGLWMAVEFRGGSERFLSLRLLAQAAAVVVAGFVANWLLFTLLAAPGTMPFSNFSYTLYGVASGGNTWQQVTVDYPELVALSESDRVRSVYGLAFDLMLTHPGRFVWGSARALYQALLPYPDQGIFSYVNFPPLQLAVSALAVLGLYRLVAVRSMVHRLMLWQLGGTLLSVPFVPLWDADAMRVYAATIPFLMALPALGVQSIRELRAPAWADSPAVTLTEKQLGRLGLAACAAVLLLPLTALAMKQWPSAATSGPLQACAPGDSLRVLELSRGAAVNLVSDDGRTALGSVRASDFLTRFGTIRTIYPEAESALATIRAPATLALAVDHRTGRGVWVVAPPGAAAQLDTPTEVCGRESLVHNMGYLFETAYHGLPE